MLPKPMTPNTAPCTSRPRYWSTSQPGHRRARRSASASHTRRDAARMRRNARSATVSSFTPGTLHTTTRWAAAAWEAACHEDACQPVSVLGVVDSGRVLHADGEAEAVDRRVVAHRSEAVHRVGWDVDEVALLDLAFLAVDHHDPPPRCDVIELVRRMRVRSDEAAARDLELTHELEETTVRDLLHLARVHEPPHGHRAFVLDHRRHVFDRSDVHRSLPRRMLTSAVRA